MVILIIIESSSIRTIPSASELHRISLNEVRRLYCRSGITPCPEDISIISLFCGCVNIYTKTYAGLFVNPDASRITAVNCQPVIFMTENVESIHVETCFTQYKQYFINKSFINPVVRQQQKHFFVLFLCKVFLYGRY